MVRGGGCAAVSLDIVAGSWCFGSGSLLRLVHGLNHSDDM